MDETEAVADATIVDMVQAVAGAVEAPIAPKAGPLGRAAGILFLTPDGETLLLCRGDGGDFPRTFGLPGGHAEEGETDEEAARREALEETGFDYTGPLTRLCTDGQFVTFIARDVPMFHVKHCDESVGFVWTKPEDAPQPLHPGMPMAFRVAAAHTEMDVAKLIRDGDLPSPQVFGNSMLFALRVTGTGQAYRTALDEFVHRDESICLAPEYLERCYVPVVWLHPKSNKLDTKSYAESNIGLTILPYIQGSEVWAIARIIDMVAAVEMAKPGAEWSTSPGVVFSDRSGNATFSLDGGSSILIEGNPALLDHLAICERGVWDKEGPSEGVQVDQPIEVLTMTEEERAKLAAEEKAKADAVAAQARADSAQPSLADVMKAVGSLAGSLTAIGSRLDSVEKNLPAPTLNASSADAARKDAEEKAAAEEKARKDSEEKAKADAQAKADADEKEEAAKRADADSEAMADCQAKADSVYQLHGKAAPRKMEGESLLGYRRRLARGLQPHSAAWKGADLSAIGDSVALGIAEAAIYADAATASRNPIVDEGAPRLPRAINTRSPSGHNVTTFAGPVGGWMDDFRFPARRMTTINKGDQK